MARLDSLVIDSATELLLTVSRTQALARVHPCHEVSTLVGVQRSPLPKPRLELNCSGLSRSGVRPLRKAPPDSSPGAPSSPLPPAALTGFPQLPHRECSTSRSCSVQRFDVRQWCYPPLGSFPPSSCPPSVPRLRLDAPSEEDSRDPLMVYQPWSRLLRPKIRGSSRQPYAYSVLLESRCGTTSPPLHVPPPRPRAVEAVVGFRAARLAEDWPVACVVSGSFEPPDVD